MKHQYTLLKKVTGFLRMVNYTLDPYVPLEWVAKNGIVQEF